MELDACKAELIERHLDEVIEMNRKINLTRVVDRESALVLHVEDSLSAFPEFSEAPSGPYADLGSGGGFPGVTLSIASGRKVLLVDSVWKKMRAMDSIVSDLGLQDSVSTYAGRIEDLSNERRGNFAVLTARALTAMPSLIELACPLLQKGGRLICYKGSNYEEELERALRIQDKLGMKLVSQRFFDLSDGSARSIFVFEKVAKPKIKLPRRVGMAQNNPLA